MSTKQKLTVEVEIEFPSNKPTEQGLKQSEWEALWAFHPRMVWLGVIYASQPGQGAECEVYVREKRERRSELYRLAEDARGDLEVPTDQVLTRATWTRWWKDMQAGLIDHVGFDC